MAMRLIQQDRSIGLPVGTVRACRAAAAVVVGTLLATAALLMIMGLLGGRPILEQHMWRGKNVDPGFSQTAFDAPPPVTSVVWQATGERTPGRTSPGQQSPGQQSRV